MKPTSRRDLLYIILSMFVLTLGTVFIPFFFFFRHVCHARSGGMDVYAGNVAGNRGISDRRCDSYGVLGRFIWGDRGNGFLLSFRYDYGVRVT